MTKHTLLIVEDNDVNRKLVVDMAQFHGMSVLEADNGDTAIALAKEHMPTIILMDIQLRGKISGVEAMVALKSDENTKHIPIIAVTAFAMRGDKERILETGCEEYISKPFTMDSLFKVIGRYVEIKK